ncbi:MAG: O-antigen ligase family protein [Thermoleophilia bacterium]
MVSDWLGKLRGALAKNPGAPAGFVVVAIAIAWAEKDGATDPLVWLPGTLLIVGLLVVVAVAAPGHVPGGTAGLIAIVSFAAFTAWCFASIAWADVQADAWAGANRTLAYFAIYTLLALRPWRTRPAAALLGFYSIGIAAVGLWAFLHLDAGADPRTAFIAGRLIEPISYANANCALFVSAAVPALFLSSRREMPFVLRGVLLASAGVLIELALLCQSRMSLLATPVVLAAYFAFTPGRLRSALSLAILAVAVAASRAELLDVFTTVYGTDPSAAPASERLAAAIDASQRVVLLSAIGLAMAGIAWGLIDERFRVPRSAVRVVGLVVVILMLGATVAGSAVFAQRYGNPVDRVGIWWDRFKSNEYVSDADTSHLMSGFGGAGRYAIWTVSYDIFKRHPLVGTGIDTFGVDWARERPNTQDNIYPHSVELRTLQQTGLIGSLLLCIFIAGALVGALRRIRARPPVARGIAISSLLVFGYWCVHGSVDWLWEVPALSAAAFCFLGLGVALSDPDTVEEPPHAPWRRWVAMGLAGAFALLTIVALVPPLLSDRQVEAALRSVAAPTVAYEYLDRASSLNPLASEPDLLGSVIAEQSGDVARQRAFLVRAISRNPYDWFAHVQIALLDARAGDRVAALRSLERARRLDPRDASILFAAERIRAGKPPTAAEMNELYIQSAASCCLP